jgi:hypothetical protein
VDEKRYGIDLIIPKFWPVNMTDPEFERKTGLRSVLKLIREPRQGFSKLAAKLAGILYKKFERQNWGLPDEEDDEALFSLEEPAEDQLSVKKRHVRSRLIVCAEILRHYWLRLRRSLNDRYIALLS